MNSSEEAEGGEVLLTKGVSSSPVLLSIASFINKLAGGKDFANTGSSFNVPDVETDNSLLTEALNHLREYQPVILTGVTDRGIYTAYQSGKPQGAF